MPLAVRLLSVVALALAPALGVVAYNELDLRRFREAEAREGVSRSTERIAGEVRQIAENVQRFSAIVAKMPEVRAAAQGGSFSVSCSDLLTSLRQDYPGQLEFGIANAQGLIVCTTQGARNPRRVEGGHFQQAMTTNAFVVGTYGESRTTGGRFLTFAHPIRNDSGSVAGAVLAGLDLQWLEERLRPFVGSDHAVLGVHDRDVTYLARVPDDGGFIGKKPPAAMIAAAARLGNTGVVETRGADGLTRIGAIASIAITGPSPDLHVAYGVSRDAVFSEMDEATRRGVALLLLSGLLAVFAAWYTARRFIRKPVEQLLDAARQWQAGHYQVRLARSRSSSEFGQLAAAYNEMADALATRERHQRLLINELNHRVKNTLATVQSLALQSFRAKGSEVLEGTDAAHRAFEARLFALAQAHDVLTRENWEGADLTDIVAGVVAIHGHRVRVDGPSVRLPPQTALSLAMALHELGTNAAKYGALSNRSGYVTITWAVEGNERKHLHLSWTERDGPPVEPPTRRGFGSRLIERSLAAELGGDVRLAFDRAGVVCSIEAALPPALVASD